MLGTGDSYMQIFSCKKFHSNNSKKKKLVVQPVLEENVSGEDDSVILWRDTLW
uniref:Alternative protein ITPRIPL2 n=1 Tax=Homo sapiens TaxID=9606 RepID=L8EC69_HUMAN|nr:alternative protein ITPRIPL2 [Homo sapiens]